MYNILYMYLDDKICTWMTRVRRGGITLYSKGKISVRFRKISISLFTVAFIIMATVMFFAFDSVTKHISAEYAGRYATSSAEALSAHITKEIGLMSVAANTDIFIEWLIDEFNEEKKTRSFEMLSSIVGQLYSYNMYIGVNSSLNEYRAESAAGSTGSRGSHPIEPVAILDHNVPTDAWFFDSINSGKRYVISVDIDHMMQRKRVWVNYIVEKEGTPLGVICTGLEFSHIVGEIFSQYGSNNMRGLIIDNEGIIHMDSSLMENNEFLHNEYITAIRDEFSDPVIIDAIEAHLNKIDGYWEGFSEPGVVDVSSGPFRFMTIAPIRHTNWSIIILSDTTTLFDTSYFIPIMITVLTLLIAFAVISNTASYRILFKPLQKLDDSLAQLNEHSTESIFGAEREDELGHLSNTIQDLFNKANVDPLTGLYNRRYMDSSMERIMGLLSRSDGSLSVLMLDIDFFKRYNDTYGHDAGDKCLQAVAHALSYTVSRVNDLVVRYGGEEFAIILPNTDMDGASVFAEKLIHNVHELNIPHEKNEAAKYVTISIGVTTGKVDYKQDLSMYLKRADEALYTSKESGRNKYTYLDFIST